MSEAVTFKASFPAIQSAIKVGDTGMRIQLDIPETEMANAVQLLAMRNVVLRVTVEIEPCKTGLEQENGQKRNIIQARPKRKSEWKAAQQQGLDGTA